MDIQTRKIEFIQEFLKLQNEELISRFEKLLRSEKKENNIKPFTVDEFNDRMNKSLDDSETGRLTKASDLKAEIRKWV